MQEAEFDLVADEYAAMHARSVAASGEDLAFFARYKVEDAAREARRAGLDVRRALDFGCGIGNSLPFLHTAFPTAEIVGADVSQRSLDIARQRAGFDRLTLHRIEDQRLPMPDGSVDLAFTACVFHHIPEAEHRHWLSELRRVTRPGGLLMLFEHNPLNPLTRRAVNDCPFDANAVLIRAREMARRAAPAEWRSPRIVYRLFFPHALRFARPLERLMTRLPAGAQYYLRATR
jgi:ubiquinone/menaquinone biosynthesis C-methylase UbiE